MKIDIIKHLHKFKIDNPMVNLYKQQNPRFCHAMKLKIGLKNLVTIKMNEIFLSCLLRSKAQIRCSEIKTKVQKKHYERKRQWNSNNLFKKGIYKSFSSWWFTILVLHTILQIYFTLPFSKNTMWFLSSEWITEKWF